MPAILSLAVVAAFCWGLYTGRITVKQIPSLLLLLAGAALTLRGQLPIGIGVIALGTMWLAGSRRRGSNIESSDQHLLKARAILGAPAGADAETIRQLHRKAMSNNHPDLGGNNARAAELNAARDLLLSEIERNSG